MDVYCCTLSDDSIGSYFRKSKLSKKWETDLEKQ